VEAVGLNQSGPRTHRRDAENRSVLRGPLLVDRGPAAAVLQSRVHGAREKRRHLGPAHIGCRVEGRGGSPGRDPKGEDLEEEGTERVAGRVEEGTTSRAGARDASTDNRSESQQKDEQGSNVRMEFHILLLNTEGYAFRAGPDPRRFAGGRPMAYPSGA